MNGLVFQMAAFYALPFELASNPTIQYYYIKSKLNGHVLELRDRSQKECTYVVTAPLSRGADHQLWYFKRADDGYLYIVAKLNDLVLDIKGAWRWRGGYLITYPKKASPKIVANQRWTLQIREGGYIVSQFTSMVAQVKDMSGQSGSYVWVYPKKKMSDSPQAIASQKWEFIRHIPENPRLGRQLTVPQGEGSLIGDGNIQALTATLSQRPQVVVESGVRYYFIKSCLNDLVMEIKKGNEHTGVGVVMAVKDEGLCHQLWYFKPAADNHVYIISKMNDLVLEIKDVRQSKGATVALFTRNHPPDVIVNQCWKIDKDGYISSQLNQQVMTVKGKSMKTRTPVIMWKNDAVINQRWTFEPSELNSYIEDELESYVGVDVNVIRSPAGQGGGRLRHIINERVIHNDVIVSGALPEGESGQPPTMSLVSGGTSSPNESLTGTQPPHSYDRFSPTSLSSTLPQEVVTGDDFERQHEPQGQPIFPTQQQHHSVSTTGGDSEQQRQQALTESCMPQGQPIHPQPHSIGAVTLPRSGVSSRDVSSHQSLPLVVNLPRSSDQYHSNQERSQSHDRHMVPALPVGPLFLNTEEERSITSNRNLANQSDNHYNPQTLNVISKQSSDNHTTQRVQADRDDSSSDDEGPQGQDHVTFDIPSKVTHSNVINNSVSNAY